MIERCIRRARLAAPNAQILVSDGGSLDRTVEIASREAEVLRGPAGRGRQLNLAASVATGAVLLFLHADTLMPAEPIERAIMDSVNKQGAIGGNFRVTFSPSGSDTWLLEKLYRIARPLGIYFGDSAIFVRRDLFLAKGGFQQQQLMEDVELTRWMRRIGRCCSIPLTVETSSRRFAGKTMRHLVLWTLLHVLYFLGAPDWLLARLYREAR